MLEVEAAIMADYWDDADVAREFEMPNSSSILGVEDVKCGAKSAQCVFCAYHCSDTAD